jgi:hypothetical protein
LLFKIHKNYYLNKKTALGVKDIIDNNPCLTYEIEEIEVVCD